MHTNHIWLESFAITHLNRPDLYIHHLEYNHKIKIKIKTKLSWQLYCHPKLRIVNLGPTRTELFGDTMFKAELRIQVDWIRIRYSRIKKNPDPIDHHEKN